ncbi:hypothetical protein PTSG_08300 [Salpingoeca rosetta]|uniref:Wax synthase domain-containing protein n=1 Tax=Salpingoeca rosetta (strain ATCC 50818 / BSB-021) TaxID=946362 RepID=F2UJA9_SALR5|nr:uncharacterized protein PTSG_08300 [Salpingoeca rosetta]EGD77208.1 hypothetical protein PTSG_08300 [Salpingoeca rosetta]|eukprot:XP_004990552.1 hypothetical protein PTSG_08300 [Salpingoeca rosetta]
MMMIASTTTTTAVAGLTLCLWYVAFAVAAVAVRWHWPWLGLVLSTLAPVIMVVIAPTTLPLEVVVIYSFGTITQYMRVCDVVVAALAQHKTPTRRPRRGSSIRLNASTREGETLSSQSHDQRTPSPPTSPTVPPTVPPPSLSSSAPSPSSSAPSLSSAPDGVSVNVKQPRRHRRHAVFFSSSTAFAVMYILAYHDLTLGKWVSSSGAALRVVWRASRSGLLVHALSAAALGLLMGLPHLTVEQAREARHLPHDADNHHLNEAGRPPWQPPAHSELLPTFFSFSGLFGSAETAAVAGRYAQAVAALAVHTVVLTYGVTSLYFVDMLWGSILSLGCLSCRSTVDMPRLWAAGTVREFWRSWNLEMQHLLHLAIYWPLKPVLGGWAAEAATFAASALLHVLPFAVGGATARHLAMIAAFFMAQPCLMLLESCCAAGHVFVLRGWLWVWGSFFLTTFLLTLPAIEFALPHLLFLFH